MLRLNKTPMTHGTNATDAGVATFARELLFEYTRSKLLLKSLERANHVYHLSGPVEGAIRKLKISQTLADSDIASLQNVYLKELFSIAAFGIETGVNVGEALELFIKRLEREMALRNKLKVKIGSAQVLTHMGMGVFFPLFSSISAVILNSSLGLFDVSASTASQGFVLLASAYVPIILYLSAAFAHPEKSFPQNLLSILPYLTSALSILYFVPNILPHVL